MSVTPRAEFAEPIRVDVERRDDAAFVTVTGVLDSINDHNIHRLHELLPWNWASERERRKLAA